MTRADVHTENKDALAPLRRAQYDFCRADVLRELERLIEPNCAIHWGHPFGDMVGHENFWEKTLEPLAKAMPDLERRDWIVIAGESDDGENWVGCGGFYCGTFLEPFLDIVPSGHLAHMRFHEFYRFEEGKVAEMQGIFDVPELMMQAGAWPMAPSLGREWCVPAPASQDGLASAPYDAKKSGESKELVKAMLADMKKHPKSGIEAMNLPKYWHPKMNWYGPAGIGTARGLTGFRQWHQIPFLRAMPDRGQYPDQIKAHFFAEGDFVGVTGWPNMRQTLSNDGWLGLPPAGQTITMRSLDFWRLENGLIRENWVMVDLLDVYRQLEVDVLGRMGEFNKAKPKGGINLPRENF